MGTAAGAAQQGAGIGLPLIQLHEADDPLVTGGLDILAQEDIGHPYQGIEPVQGQGQEADHLDPVVPLVQVGPLVGQDVLAALAVHAHGDIDFGLDKAQNKGRLDLVAFPAAPDPDSVPDLVFQPQVGDQTIDGKACRNDGPDPGQNSRPFQAGNFGKGQRKFRLKAQIAADLNGQQQADACQQPQEADIFFRGFQQHQAQQKHRKNQNASVNAGDKQILQEAFHGCFLLCPIIPCTRQ